MDSVNKWLTLAANFGVIAGILFLAVELNQNNELLEAEAREARYEFRSRDSNRIFLENPGLVELMVKVNNRELLTQEEQYTIDRFYNQILLNFQLIFIEYIEGHISESELGTASMKDYFNNQVGLKQYWVEYGSVVFQPNFVDWMEENIVNAEN